MSISKCRRKCSLKNLQKIFLADLRGSNIESYNYVPSTGKPAVQHTIFFVKTSAVNIAKNVSQSGQVGESHAQNNKIEQRIYYFTRADIGWQHSQFNYEPLVIG